MLNSFTDIWYNQTILKYFLCNDLRGTFIMKTSIYTYRLYDVADEINLDSVQALWMSRNKIASRLRLNRISIRSIQFQNPPVLVALGSHELKIGGKDYFVDVYARIFDIGVISIIFNVQPDEDITRQGYMDLVMGVEDMPDEEFRSFLDATLETIQPACANPNVSGFDEDFTVYYFQDPVPQDWDIAPFLLKDREPVNEGTRQDVLSNQFSYADDVTYLTWDSALVYDATGSTDIPDLLEFANAQYLELRYYDNFLNHAIDKTYDVIGASDATQTAKIQQFRTIRDELLETMADVSSLTSNITNALLVTEDVFYAKVYAHYLDLLKAHVWQENIELKMQVLQRCYNMINDAVANHQMEKIRRQNHFLLLIMTILLAIITVCAVMPWASMLLFRWALQG